MNLASRQRLATAVTDRRDAPLPRRSLVVCTHYPLPEASGFSMRTMHFVRYLQRLGSVDLACSFELPPTGDPSLEMFGQTYLLPVVDQASFRRRLIGGMRDRWPIPLFEYEAAALDRLVDAIETKDYDHILIRYMYPSALLRRLRWPWLERSVVDVDDRLSGSLYESKYADKRRVAGALLDANRRLLVAHENRVLRSGRVIVCTDEEADAVGGPKRPFVVPNLYVRPSRADPSDGSSLPLRLLFVGSLGYEPNIDGLRWFVDEVFAPLRRSRPEAELDVVGRRPSESLRTQLEAQPGVHVHADVDDVGPYYERARATVVPLLSGGGTRIKILEAAHARRPVLSTRLGADGLDLVPGVHYLAFDDSVSFASALDALADTGRYQGIADAAALHVAERFSTAAIDTQMAKVFGAAP